MNRDARSQVVLCLSGILLLAGGMLGGCSDDDSQQNNNGNGNANANNNNGSMRCGNGVQEGTEECDLGEDNSDSAVDGCRTDCRNAHCNDGVKDTGEGCDTDDFGGETCADHDLTFGKLACNTDCSVDTSDCRPLCGSGTIEQGEECEGTNLNSASCSSVGFYGGTLRCSPSCQFDDSGCSDCGDGAKGAGEECDGNDLDSQTCATLTGGLLTGTPTCSSGCKFVLSACTGAPVTCGNGLQEGNEQCDGWDLNDTDCATLHPTLYGGGTLTCTATCAFDTQHCTPIVTSYCGDGARNENRGEQCDGSDLGTGTCASLGFTGGTLACNAACQYDLSGCTAPTTCDDNQVDLAEGEACDGDDLGSFTTCAALGYAGGTLACASNCTLDTSRCTSCGDGVRNGNDQCDGSDLGGQTCEGIGYSEGTLACTSSCTLDATGCGTCVPEQCNGLDDDCDGEADNGFGCILGEVDYTCIKPSCGVGQRTCEAGCVWGPCDIPEVCNGLDDNCEDGADEDFQCVLGATRSCTNTCGTGTEDCAAGCTWSGVCTVPELCNGVDDDCDLGIDEDYACVQNEILGCTTSCGSFGSQLCSAACTLGACVAPPETCNNSDDDCDGDVDEALYGNVTSTTMVLSPDTLSGFVGAAWNGTELALVWEDDRNGYNELFFNRFDAQGAVLDTAVSVAGAVDVTGMPWVTPMGTEWGISWISGSPGQVQFARVDSTNTVVLSPTTVTSYVSGASAAPFTAWNGNLLGLLTRDDTTGHASFSTFTSAGALLITPVDLTAPDPLHVIWNGASFAVLTRAWPTLYFDLRDTLGGGINSDTVDVGSNGYETGRIHFVDNRHFVAPQGTRGGIAEFDISGNFTSSVDYGYGSVCGFGCKPDASECLSQTCEGAVHLLRSHPDDVQLVQPAWDAGVSHALDATFWTGTEYLFVTYQWSNPFGNLTLHTIGCP